MAMVKIKSRQSLVTIEELSPGTLFRIPYTDDNLAIRIAGKQTTCGVTVLAITLEKGNPICTNMSVTELGTMEIVNLSNSSDGNYQ